MGRKSVPWHPARVEACEKGEELFFTNEPCIRGHICARTVKRNRCLECLKEFREKHNAAHRSEINEYRRNRRKELKENPYDRKNIHRKLLTVTVEGQEIPLIEAALRFQIDVNRVYSEASAKKVSHQAMFDLLVSRAKGERTRNKRISMPKVTVDNQPVSIAEAAQILNIPGNRIYNTAKRLEVSYQEAVDAIAAKLKLPPEEQRKRGSYNAEKKEYAPSKPKNYVDNSDMLAEIAKSKDRGQMTDRLAKMMILMSKRFFTRVNYAKYGFRDEMADESLMHMFGAWQKFNPEKSQNPFSYFTEIMKNVANRFLIREKKSREVLDESRIISDISMEEEAPGSRSRNPGAR